MDRIAVEYTSVSLGEKQKESQ